MMKVEKMLILLKNDVNLSILRKMTPGQAYEIISKKFPRLKNRGKKRAMFMILLRDEYKINLPICPNFLVIEEMFCCKALGNPIPTTCRPPHDGQCILLNEEKKRKMLAV